MTAAEKILADIKKSAEREAQERQEAFAAQIEKIEAAAKLDAQAAADEVLGKAKARVRILEETGRSGAATVLRDALLSCRREQIEETFAAAKEKLLALSDGEYFAFLSAVLGNTNETAGTLFLSERDLARDTSDFETALTAKNITLSKTAANIDGGFLLKNGEIEINASVEALFREKHSDLVDATNRILFQ